MNDTAAAHVRFNSAEAAANTPTLVINYEYPIAASAQIIVMHII